MVVDPSPPGSVAPCRFLFSFAGGMGHFLPLRPLARALAVDGHEVAFGAQTSLLPTVTAAGFRAFATGGATFRAGDVRTPLLSFDLAREYRTISEGFAGRIARERASATIALARDWQPDVIVCDEMDFGCMIAAERLNIPHATVLVIASGQLAPPELVAEPLGALLMEHGLAPGSALAMLSRHLVLSPFPRCFRHPRNPLPATAHLFSAGSPAAPTRTSPRPGCPTVYVTLGTVFNVEAGDLLQRILSALADLPIEIVASTGPQIDPAELGPQPGNVELLRFVDQSSLLPRCSLVVCHAGSGTMLAALSHGLPMLLLPIGADQTFNAARCKVLGVARVLDPLQTSAAEMRDVAASVLASEETRDAARRVQEEIAQMPDQSTATALLLTLARSSATTSSLPGRNAASRPDMP